MISTQIRLAVIADLPVRYLHNHALAHSGAPNNNGGGHFARPSPGNTDCPSKK